MANLAIAFTASQSADGSTITITDETNWGDNTSGYTESQFVKSFILTDYVGNPIATIPLATGVYITTYTVPSGTNPWINIEFSAVGPITLTVLQKYAFARYFELAYIAANKASCGCRDVNRVDMCQIDTMYTIAELAVPIGAAPDYQNQIDGAYKLLAA